MAASITRHGRHIRPDQQIKALIEVIDAIQKGDNMQYEILGGSFPAVKCTLAKGEVMKCEGGSMSWMDRGL